MRTIVFAGPTLVPTDGGFDHSGPAQLGSVFRAVEAGYRRIAIVDGAFGNVPSVWHKEILHALAGGVQVFGAASIGALRAAELYNYGMVGVGLIYRLYRSGRLVDDDELCVLHAVPELQYAPLTIPMINARLTLRRLVRHGHLTGDVAGLLCLRLRTVHFSERTADAVRTVFQRALVGGSEEASDLFFQNYVDQKRQDAAALLYRLAYPTISKPRDWSFPLTFHWHQQFEMERSDLPPLLLRDPNY